MQSQSWLSDISTVEKERKKEMLIVFSSLLRSALKLIRKETKREKTHRYVTKEKIEEKIEPTVASVIIDCETQCGAKEDRPLQQQSTTNCWKLIDEVKILM